jgi:hypothetical protein
LSLHSQYPLLISSNGLLPSNQFIKTLEQSFNKKGLDLYLSYPTISVLAPTFGVSVDGLNESILWMGIISSTLIFFGYHNFIIFGIAWLSYLSIYLIGQSFLSFQVSYHVEFSLSSSQYDFSEQWDILLLEVGILCVATSFITIFNPSSSVIGMTNSSFRFLAFKLMFLAGLVKLQANCPKWLNLSALEYHFATQPLPTVMAWYAHQIPPFILRLATAATYVIEIPAALALIFPTAYIRRLSVVLQILLQLLIIITGNYNFFNFMTMVLMVIVWESDGIVRITIPKKFTEPGQIVDSNLDKLFDLNQSCKSDESMTNSSKALALENNTNEDNIFDDVPSVETSPSITPNNSDYRFSPKDVGSDADQGEHEYGLSENNKTANAAVESERSLQFHKTPEKDEFPVRTYNQSHSPDNASVLVSSNETTPQQSPGDNLKPLSRQSSKDSMKLLRHRSRLSRQSSQIFKLSLTTQFVGDPIVNYFKFIYFLDNSTVGKMIQIVVFVIYIMVSCWYAFELKTRSLPWWRGENIQMKINFNSIQFFTDFGCMFALLMSVASCILHAYFGSYTKISTFSNRAAARQYADQRRALYRKDNDGNDKKTWKRFYVKIYDFFITFYWLVTYALICLATCFWLALSSIYLGKNEIVTCCVVLNDLSLKGVSQTCLTSLINSFITSKTVGERGISSPVMDFSVK